MSTLGPSGAWHVVDDSDATPVSVLPNRIITINGEYANDFVVLHWWQNYARSLGE